MKLWLIGGTIVGLLGVSFYLAAVKRSGPAPATPEPAIVVAVEPKTTAPALLVLTEVVDVSNIDHLLDPIASSDSASEPASGPVITQVGYEEEIPRRKPSINVQPIPKSPPDPRIIVCAEEEITRTEGDQPGPR